MKTKLFGGICVNVQDFDKTTKTSFVTLHLPSMNYYAEEAEAMFSDLKKAMSYARAQRKRQYFKDRIRQSAARIGRPVK